MKNYTNKNGEICKKAQDAMKFLSGGKWKLLSSFYASKSTNVAEVLYSDLFEICTDKKTIVSNGFSPLAKAIVRINMNNPDAAKFVEDLNKKAAAEAANARLRAQEFNSNVEKAKAFISENSDEIEELRSIRDNSIMGKNKFAGVVSFFAHNKGLSLGSDVFRAALRNYEK